MGAGLTLVILDGHAGVRAALAQRLRSTPGVHVAAAVDDVDEAVRLVGTVAPDAVLYEPKTTSGDAEVVLRRLAQVGCPVVILTSSLLDGEQEALTRAGAAAVTLKGTSIVALLRTIDVAVSASRPQQQTCL